MSARALRHTGMETAAHTPSAAPGRVLALDLGEKRIGVAISDPLRQVARSLTILPRCSRAEDAAAIGRLIAEHTVTLVVVGLPTYLDGRDSAQTAWVRDYAAVLAAQIAIPLVLHDETLTTAEARANLRARSGVGRRSGRRPAQPVDAVAAAHILQRFLDETLPAQRPA